jgi:hypothetical protein
MTMIDWIRRGGAVVLTLGVLLAGCGGDESGSGDGPPQGPGSGGNQTLDQIRENCLSQARQLPADGRRQQAITDCRGAGK